MIVKGEDLNRFKSLRLIARWAVEGFLSGLHRSPYHGTSAEFLDYRHYSPGDDLRRLDWKVYGRTDRTYIKRSQSETNLKAYVLLDTSASMSYAVGGRSKSDYAKGLAACLLYLFHRQGDAVGLVTFSNRIERWYEAKTTRRHLQELFSLLEEVPFRGTSALRPVLAECAGRIGSRRACLLISDFYEDPHGVGEGFRQLRFQHNEVIAFHVVDPTEEDFPFRGLHNVVDLETGQRLMVDPPVVRDQYRTRFRTHCRRLTQVASDCRSELVLLRTDTPFAEALASYVHRRGARRL